MNENDLNIFIGKHVFLVLKSGRRYTGKIINIANNSIHLIDIFKDDVFIDISEISSIEIKREVDR